VCCISNPVKPRALAGTSKRTVRSWCANLDPRRANRLRHPTIRLLAEYPLGYVRMLFRAPLTGAERLRCLGHLVRWMASRVVPPSRRRQHTPVEQVDEIVSVALVVAGQEGRL
jgi:hypothetical protein